MAEILLNASRAKKHPIKILIISFLYTTISIFISSLIFPQYASLVSILLTILPCFYLVQNSLRIEERKEFYYKEKLLLKRHKKIILLFLNLFLGIVMAFALCTYIFPSDVSLQLFHAQDSVLLEIQSRVTGNATMLNENLAIIILNNVKVLIFSLVLSLIYGAGAIFVLAWNASVMGYVIGGIAKANGVLFFPAAFLKYFIHGIPEMISYFITILIGGIFYFSVITGDFRNKEKMKKILIDALFLLMIAFSFLIISALIETCISPLL